jgi:hypothetical protein
MHELEFLHYSLQCWRNPKLLPLLGYEEKHSDQISRQRHSRQCTYQRNIVARSCNHYCNGKAIATEYCMCIALVIQHAMHKCQVWPVPLYNIFALSKKSINIKKVT